MKLLDYVGKGISALLWVFDTVSSNWQMYQQSLFDKGETLGGQWYEFDQTMEQLGELITNLEDEFKRARGE